MKKLPTCRVIELSTRHITKDDNDYLEDQAEKPNHQQDLPVWNTGYGWLIPCMADEYGDTVLTCGATLGISEALQRLIRRANKQGARFLLLDRDGPVVEGLRRFKW